MAEKIYILMNKPAGYVCSAVSDSHKTVYQLLPEELQLKLKAKRGERLHTVGRLDCDTTGLLILTTDGQFSNHLTRHENNISKTYEVTLAAPVPSESQESYIATFKTGLQLPAEKKAPVQFVKDALLKFENPTHCTVTISQGLFHQVKRMFLAMGNQVTGLHRTEVGEYKLPSDLKAGDWIFFTL